MRVLLAGDSQMAGLATPLKRMLRDRGDLVVATDARIGRPTHEFIDLPRKVREARAELVVIALGGNDQAARSRPAEYVALVRRLGEALVATGARVHWWGPAFALWSNVDDRHRAAAERQREAIAETGVQWHDSRSVTRAGHRDDGVHFTDAAYRRWASVIVSKLTGSTTMSTAVGAFVLIAAGVAAALAIAPTLRDRPRDGFAYPPQPCGLDYDGFRSGWTYADAYEHAAFRQGSKGVSQRAVLRELRALKRAEYERYSEECSRPLPATIPDIDPRDFLDA